MTIFYSASTGGFYDSGIHGDRIPQDAVSITEEARAALLEAESSGMMIIAPDENGYPEAVPMPAPTTEQLASSVRARRDFLLEESDWVVIRSTELNQPIPQDWLDYRADLRAIPEQPGFPQTVTWPEKPAA